MDGPYRGLDSEFQLRTHLEGEWLAFETLAQAIYFGVLRNLQAKLLWTCLSKKSLQFPPNQFANSTVHQAVVLVHGSGALALPQIDLR